MILSYVSQNIFILALSFFFQSIYPFSTFSSLSISVPTSAPSSLNFSSVIVFFPSLQFHHNFLFLQMCSHHLHLSSLSCFPLILSLQAIHLYSGVCTLHLCKRRPAIFVWFLWFFKKIPQLFTLPGVKSSEEKLIIWLLFVPFSLIKNHEYKGLIN